MTCLAVYEALYVPLDRFLLYLAAGWRFDGDVAEPIDAHHGAHACLMVRP